VADGVRDNGPSALEVVTSATERLPVTPRTSNAGNRAAFVVTRDSHGKVRTGVAAVVGVLNDTTGPG